MLRICVLGADCTGKTTICKQLAQHFNGLYVPEFARTFLSGRIQQLQLADMVSIARGQIRLESSICSANKEIAFCDGSPLASIVWSRRYFGACAKELVDIAANHPYDKYLLCSIDLPWEPDGLRNSLRFREWLERAFCTEMDQRNLPYATISGVGSERLACAISLLNIEFPQLRGHSSGGL